MKTFTSKAKIFLLLAITGLIIALYSIKIKNYILLAAAVLFAAVSADNIFCNLADNKNKTKLK